MAFVVTLAFVALSASSALAEGWGPAPTKPLPPSVFHRGVVSMGMGNGKGVPFLLSSIHTAEVTGGAVLIATAPAWIGEPFPACGLFGMKCYYDGVNDTLADRYPNGTENPPDQDVLF